MLLATRQPRPPGAGGGGGRLSHYLQACLARASSYVNPVQVWLTTPGVLQQGRVNTLRLQRVCLRPSEGMEATQHSGSETTCWSPALASCLPPTDLRQPVSLSHCGLLAEASLALLSGCGWDTAPAQ